MSDASDHLDCLNRDPRFREALQQEKLLDKFVASRRALKRTYGSWDLVRDRLGAHLDATLIASGLKKMPGQGELGGIWMGPSVADFSFQAAHAAIAPAFADHEPDETRKLSALNDLIEQVSSAQKELYDLYPCVVRAFHVITRNFFPK